MLLFKLSIAAVLLLTSADLTPRELQGYKDAIEAGAPDMCYFDERVVCTDPVTKTKFAMMQPRAQFKEESQDEWLQDLALTYLKNIVAADDRDKSSSRISEAEHRERWIADVSERVYQLMMKQVQMRQQEML